MFRKSDISSIRERARASGNEEEEEFVRTHFGALPGGGASRVNVAHTVLA